MIPAKKTLYFIHCVGRSPNKIKGQLHSLGHVIMDKQMFEL